MLASEALIPFNNSAASALAPLPLPFAASSFFRFSNSSDEAPPPPFFAASTSAFNAVVISSGNLY